MDYKTVDQATTFLRQYMAKHHDELPAWGTYQKLVEARLQDAFRVKFKMPQEYHYAYLRARGLGDADARERMGLSPGDARRKVSRMPGWAWLKFGQ